MRSLKKYLKLVWLTSLLLNFSNIYSQDKLGFYLGYNLLLNSKDNHYDVNNSGINIGLIIPINITNLKINYNVNGIFHEVKPNDEYWYYSSDFDKYLYIANSILVGQELSLDKKSVLLPQLGFGALDETVFSEWGEGFSNCSLFFDFSLLYKLTRDNFDFGIVLDYRKGFYKPDEFLVSDQFFSLNLVILK